MGTVWDITPSFGLRGQFNYEADARTAAAAPDLLEAGSLMLGLHYCDCDFCRMMIKAIAKARGEA